MIRTKRLHLRLFTIEDREFIREIDTDPEVMKYLTNGIPSSNEEVDRTIEVLLRAQEIHQGRIGYWMAVITETNTPIGWFHLRPRIESPKDESILELGYRLKKEFWGKGYATEMSQALIRYAFNDLKAKSVCAHTMKANEASQAVMKKVGMNVWFEDTYEDFPGEDKKAIWYQITQEEFEQ